MKLVGLMCCRNESWVLGLSARAALLWVDELVILDHASTDRTPQIIDLLRREYPDRIHDATASGEWEEMTHRQGMLKIARYHKATHIAIIDADEILTGNLTALGPHPWVKGDWPPIALYEASPGVIVQLPGYNLRGSLNRYHANGIWGNRWFSTAFCDDERLYWGGDNFHHREPRGMTLQPYRPIAQGDGGVMHLWGVSERRLKAKHALYKLNERLRWPDKPVAEMDRMYSWAIHGDAGNRSFGTPDTWIYDQVPASWWAPYAHLMQYLDVDAEPYQEAECKRLVLEHPGLAAGLDLFGVV